MLFRSDRKSTRLNSSHTIISYAVFCLKKKKPRRGRQGSEYGVLRTHASSRTRADARADARTPPTTTYGRHNSPNPFHILFFLKNGPPRKFPLFPPQALFRI